MSKHPEVMVRPAAFADYEAVVAMSRDVYAGIDYLPSVYFEWLHNPKNVMMVAEVDGKVIGFSAQLSVGDRVCNGGAGRIDPDYQRGGITNVLYAKASEAAINKYGLPITKIAEWTKSEKSLRQASRIEGFVLQREWYYLAYRLSNESFLKSALPTTPAIQLAMKASHHATLQEVTKPSIMAAIEELIAKGGKVFTAGHSWNTRLSDRTSIRAVAQVSNVILTFDGSHGDGDEVSAVSFTSCMASPQNCAMAYFWYYSLNRDQNVLFAHCHMVISKLESVIGDKDISIVVNFPEKLKPTGIHNYLKNKLGEIVNEPPWTMGAKCMAGIVNKSHL